jgi:hypothetical protein
VEDPVHVAQRAAQSAAVEDVAAHAVVVEAVEVVEARRLPDGEPQVVAAADERAGDVRADQSGPAGQQCLSHGRGV